MVFSIKDASKQLALSVSTAKNSKGLFYQAVKARARGPKIHWIPSCRLPNSSREVFSCFWSPKHPLTRLKEGSLHIQYTKKVLSVTVLLNITFSHIFYHIITLLTILNTHLEVYTVKKSSMLPEQEFFSLHCPHFDEIPVSQLLCIPRSLRVFKMLKGQSPKG